MNFVLKKILISVAFYICLSGCARIDVFEKNIPLKNHEWPRSVKPSVTFKIEDTLSLYHLYVVLRHFDAYNYNNLWMNVYTRSPGDSVQKQQLDLRLADNQKGWLGSGMDDIFEHRIRITRDPIRLRKAGEYQFTFEQTMRDDPLQQVLNVGLRIERVKN
jgi:gliding motility-associated lipoprotein GldH